MATEHFTSVRQRRAVHDDCNDRQRSPLKVHRDRGPAEELIHYKSKGACTVLSVNRGVYTIFQIGITAEDN